MSPSRIAAHHVGLLVLVGLQPRLRHRASTAGRAARGSRAALTMLPEVGEVEQPVDRRRRRRASASSARSSCSRSSRLMPCLDLEAHDLAEAAAAQLVLDGLQQVVGLVGDGEVGVARDPEDRRVDDLHAREQRVEVGGDDAPRAGRTSAVVASAHEARQHLLRHLHAREDLRAPVTGRAPARRATARGWRCRGTAGRGRPPAASARGRSGAGSARRARSRSSVETSSSATIRMPCSASAGRRSSLQAAAWRSQCSRHDPRGSRRVVCFGVRPSCRGVSMPASTWSCRPATRTMKNSSRLDAKIAENFSALEQRHAVVLGELEDALVEVEPGQLAVEVELGVRAGRRPRLAGRSVDGRSRGVDP